MLHPDLCICVYIYVCEHARAQAQDRDWCLGVSLHHLSLKLFEAMISHGTVSVTLVSSRDPPATTNSVLILQAHKVMPSFNMDSGALNLVPYPRAASVWPSEPSSHPCTGLWRAAPDNTMIWIHPRSPSIVWLSLMHKPPRIYVMVCLSAPRMVLVSYGRPCTGESALGPWRHSILSKEISLLFSSSLCPGW